VPVDCDDGDVCTADSCDFFGSGQCEYVATPSLACPVPWCDADVPCGPDNNPCTREVCGEDGFCRYEDIPECCLSVLECGLNQVCENNECCVASGPCQAGVPCCSGTCVTGPFGAATCP
jgi:hypothetical protein